MLRSTSTARSAMTPSAQLANHCQTQHGAPRAHGNTSGQWQGAHRGGRGWIESRVRLQSSIARSFMSRPLCRGQSDPASPAPGSIQRKMDTASLSRCCRTIACWPDGSRSTRPAPASVDRSARAPTAAIRRPYGGQPPTGGRWIPNFDPNQIVTNPWGTLTFTFTDCNHGKVDFNSVVGYGTGSMNLTRLTQPAGVTCP